MRALVRYAWTDTIRSQQWVAPLLVFFAIEAIVSADTGSLLPAYSTLAAALVFIAAWLGLIFCNSEDQVQAAVTASAAGGAPRLRLAKLLAAYLFALVVGAAGLAGPAIADPSGIATTPLIAGSCSFLLTAVAGVSFGAICSRPIITRSAWSLFTAIGMCLVTLLVPHVPPTAQVLTLFSVDHPRNLAVATIALALETVGITALVVLGSLWLARARS